jgi:hypothetical protein
LGPSDRYDRWSLSVPFPDDLVPPPALRTPEWLVRPIRTDDATLDHEAVMASKEMLRTWEQTGWPEDGFTVDENRRDLERLVARHNDGSAFTYTVLVPDESFCLGCVYIFPTDFATYERASITRLQDELDWGDYDVAVHFWVRTSGLADGLDVRLLTELRGWLDREWSIDSPLFVTSERLEQQVGILEDAGLRRVFRLDDPKESGTSLALGQVTTPAAGSTPTARA